MDQDCESLVKTVEGSSCEDFYGHHEDKVSETDCESLIQKMEYPNSNVVHHDCDNSFNEDSDTEADCIRFDNFDDTMTFTESLEIDIIYSAPPLSDLYRYHVFFSHSNEDMKWVANISQRLEIEPYCYKCYYDNSSMETNVNLVQSSLCAAMLSERVVVVLSQNYIKHKWLEFQQQLLSLTECSLYRQRMLIVLLKDCVIPESLQPMGFLDARESDFFPCFVRHLRSDRLPRSSESFSSEMTCMLYKPINMENGQLLSSIKFSIHGAWVARMRCEDDDNIPTPLCCHGINMSYSSFMDIVEQMKNVAEEKQTMFSFIFSLKPVIILIIAVIVWFFAFIFVIIYLIDEPKQSALGIRLSVFSLPLLFVLYGYYVRWKRQQLRQEICMGILTECVLVNGRLAASEKPVLLTATMTKAGIFYIHFMYFGILDCANDVDMMLVNYLEEDMVKFEILIEIYTGEGHYFHQGVLSERLTVMASVIYLHRMLMKQLPSYPQQRHTSHKFCLCQFVEQLVTDFYQCLSKPSILQDLQKFFEKRLNFQKSMRDLKKHQNALVIHDEFSFTSI